MPNSVIASSAPAAYASLATAQGRVAWRPGLPWDHYDAYLFDIDGTLLRDPGRVHYNAFSKACLEVLGHPLSLEPVTVAGSTDPRILSDAFAAAGIADETWRPHQPRLLEAICSTVERDAAEMQLTIMPGVVEALRHLAAAGKWLGVATGNLESIGWLKLERTGLRPHFTFGGFSDAHEQRGNMIAAAAAAARKLAGAGASVVIVGDTPSDIAAAHANALPVIAVATGHFSFDRLLEHTPEICAENLAALLLAGQNAAQTGANSNGHGVNAVTKDTSA
ncbi:MAG TPA: HAD family hydrolase [Acidobacteriaceae bacterium]|nr:HAD family hydrolase [Acidobacteriaceae bacterium]